MFVCLSDLLTRIHKLLEGGTTLIIFHVSTKCERPMWLWLCNGFLFIQCWTSVVFIRCHSGIYIEDFTIFYIGRVRVFDNTLFLRYYLGIYITCKDLHTYIKLY